MVRAGYVVAGSLPPPSAAAGVLALGPRLPTQWVSQADPLAVAARIGAMATREQLHREVDALPAPQVSKARIVVVEEESESEWQTVPLPEGWGTMANGEPMPDVAAGVRRSREGH